MHTISGGRVALALGFHNAEADHLLHALALGRIVDVVERDLQTAEKRAEWRRITGVVHLALVAPALATVALTAVRSEIDLVIDPLPVHVAEFT